MVEFDNWYLRRILLNFSGDNSTYLAVKELVVNNLNSMGVEASMDDGMTTLANKILDVEPTIVVDGFDIGLTLNASSDSVFVGDTVVLSTHLTAVYDTEEVDLVGDLQNATVNFYENDTLLGTSTTNSSGIATYSYTVLDGTDLSFKAVFSGTDNFDDANSNIVNVSVEELPEDYLELKGNGDTLATSNYDFQEPGVIGTNMKVDCCCGSGIHSIDDEGGYFSCSWEDNQEVHTVKVYGVSEILDHAFYDQHLIEVSIPTSVTYIGSQAFSYNPNLALVTLYWEDADEIPVVRSVFYNTGSNLAISIPYGTSAFYENAGYPSEKLVERSE